MTALAGNGLWMLAAGALVTLFVSASIMWASMRLLKMDWVSATGTLGGTQTQPAILSYIGDLAHSEAPNAAYAAIMPAAMIIKIIAAQLLLFWLL
jgi:putative transport protein